ncbi:AMP-binding protein [Microbacterium sp. MEC084]|uniref:AMP-binding protein n=1 Tax=Microbacterium sp. MEC084 TaxID=1963027 RepID=UPI001430F5DE|nr:AMP-binding protein [Microbacterium sp. MEC084]MCD1270017.1 AMP-binding protein [Microbacterium sp. MEC084]
MRRSISKIFADAARDTPDCIVVTDAAGDLTAAALDAAATRLAWELIARGVRRDDLVTITLPNTRAFIVACVGTWRAGATPQPVAIDRSPGQRLAIARVARPSAAIGAPTGISGMPTIDDPLALEGRYPSTAPPDSYAASWKAPTSSGSTGSPKLVVATGPALFDPTRPAAEFLPLAGVQLVSGPLSHSAVFTYAMRGLMTGHRLVVLPRFDERAWLDAVERHAVTWALLVPTMMRRLLRLPEAERSVARVRSIETVLHMGAPCAPDLKRGFLAWLGPERVVEVYAGSESNGLTLVRGDEWLRHPGTVGRPVGGTEILIRRSDGSPAAVGEAGEVWMRRGTESAYRYLGAASARDDDGWDTLRDIGHVDEEGRLYLRDRSDDVIVRGGEKIYPAEVEAVLEAHPAVRGAVAFGVPHPELGAVVAAVADIAGADIDERELRAWAAERLDPARRPCTLTLVRQAVRNDAGKTSRAAWREACRSADGSASRSGASGVAMSAPR